MKHYTIKLKSVSDVKDFVNIAATLPEECDISVGRYTVDGKSIMGLFSLNLAQPLNLTVYGERDSVYREKLAAFLA